MAVWLKRLFVFIGGITCVFLTFYFLGLPSIPSMSWNRTWYQPKTNEKFGISVFSRHRNITAEKWIVITTRSHPTPEFRFLANIPGWNLVAVGDDKTPKNWSLANCIYLSLDGQRGLGLETETHIPIDSYARKTVGYLFAIAHGAKVIYETDDGYQPVDLLKSFVLNKTMWGLSYEGKGLFNPYRHFGQMTLWPRGFPLSEIGDNFTSKYKLDHYKTPSVQQGIANGNPDIDAIIRLTRKPTLSVLNVTFDGRAPPAIVPAGVFSPFNSQNTLFLYDALWALLIPTTMTYRVCDIWRGYWAQRLLWEIGGNLGFFPPNVFHKGNSRSYTQDAHEEKDVYFQTEKLITFLAEWKCKSERSFFECMIQLSTDMVNNNFWKERDKLITQSWVRDLTACGYREPQRIPFGTLTHGVRSIDRKVLPKQSRSTQAANVTLWPVEQIPPLTYLKVKSSPMVSHIVQISSFCRNNLVNISRLSPVTSLRTFNNILLIIVFNFPNYGNVPFLEAMYKMHFPHILYCGTDHRTFSEHVKYMKPVSFIEVDIYRGWFAQNCLTQAMKMNYHVDGYLYIGDDTLLNVWNLHKVPWDKLWLVGGTILIPSVKTNWIWIKNPTVGLLRYQAARNASQSLDKERFKKFFSILANNTGDKDRLMKGASDIAYVPKRYKEDALYFLEHFSRFNLFVEIAIPTVFHGLVSSDQVYKLPGRYLWYDGKRKHFEKYFNSSDIFLHPVKISVELKTDKGKAFYCKNFLPLTLEGRK